MPWWSVPERDIPEHYDWHHQSPGFVFLRTNHKSSLTGVTYLDLGPHTEAEFLDEIQKKVFRVFLLLFIATSTALPWHLISSNSHNLFNSFYSSLLFTVKEKGAKPDGKPCLLLYGSIQKPQVWQLSRLYPETSTKLYVNEFGFRRWIMPIAIRKNLVLPRWPNLSRHNISQVLDASFGGQNNMG